MQNDAILHRALRRDEQVLWTGEPRVGLLTHPHDKWYLAGGTVLLAITGWLFASAAINANIIELWLVAPWFLLALHLTAGRLALRIDRRRRITYAVTNLRVMMAIDGTTLHVQSIGLRGISTIEMHHDPQSETATVRFAPTSRLVQFLEATGVAPLGVLGPPVAFVDVAGADRIASLIPHATVSTTTAAVAKKQPAAIDLPAAEAQEQGETENQRVDRPAMDGAPATAEDAEPAPIRPAGDFAARFEQLRRQRAS